MEDKLDQIEKELMIKYKNDRENVLSKKTTTSMNLNVLKLYINYLNLFLTILHVVTKFIIGSYYASN